MRPKVYADINGNIYMVDRPMSSSMFIRFRDSSRSYYILPKGFIKCILNSMVYLDEL